MIAQLVPVPRQRFRPKVQAGGRIYTFPEVRSREQKLRVEQTARETLQRTGNLAAMRVRRAREELAADDLNDLRRTVVPEKMLLLHVLELTGRDLLSSKQSLRRAARAWFESDDRSHLLTFSTICDALGRDPAPLRRRFLNEGGFDVATR